MGPSLSAAVSFATTAVSAPIAACRTTIAAQLERGIGIPRSRFGVERFIAYFQAGTNTHGPLDKLRRVYSEAIAHPQVIGLAVGTRPDSVPEPVLDLLCEFSRRVPVFLELGLQTIHNRSLDWMNRGHHFDAFLDAVGRCAGRDLDLCAHVILGLPGESHEEMLATARDLSRLPVHGVKIHNLYVVGDAVGRRAARGDAVRLLGVRRVRLGGGATSSTVAAAHGDPSAVGRVAAGVFRGAGVGAGQAGPARVRSTRSLCAATAAGQPLRAGFRRRKPR